MGEIKIEYRKLDEIKPYEKNPRNNSRAINAVAKSIQEFGFKVPLVVTANGEIVCGHTRYAAAIKLGLSELPTVTATDLTPTQIKAFRIADNKTAELAEWDFGLLEAELNVMFTPYLRHQYVNLIKV